jgi:hypothetical protein
MAFQRENRLDAFLTSVDRYMAHSGNGLQKFPAEVASHRQSAAEFLVYLTDEYKVAEETLVHALVLLDRYISSALISTGPPSLESMIRTSVACFMISTKLKEVCHPTLRDLQEITSCDCEDLLHSEEDVLQSLDWDIYSVSGEFDIFLQTSTARWFCVIPASGLDIIEAILEKYEGRRSFKKYSSFLVQISHFETELVSRFSYSEMAVASILVTADLFADPAARNLVPAFLISDRIAQAVVMLSRVAAQRGLKPPSFAKPAASPSNVDTTVAMQPTWT